MATTHFKEKGRGPKELQEFRKGLSKSLSPSQIHSRELEFMAQNGIRQVGALRVGIFADRFRPEPVYNEINASQQHMLNLLYKEALSRGVVESFLSTLSKPTHCRDTPSGADTPMDVVYLW